MRFINVFITLSTNHSQLLTVSWLIVTLKPLIETVRALNLVTSSLVTFTASSSGAESTLCFLTQAPVQRWVWTGPGPAALDWQQITTLHLSVNKSFTFNRFDSELKHLDN